MKILIVLSVLLSLLFASMIAWAVFTSPETILRSEITVQVPAPVVFKLISSPDAFLQKLSLIKDMKPGNTPDTRITTYRFGTRTRTITEKVRLEPALKQIYSEQTSGPPGALTGNIKNAITVKTLPDGAVSISWQLQYSSLSIGARLLNSIFIRPKIQQALDLDMEALQVYIER